MGYQSHLRRLKQADVDPAVWRRGVFNMGCSVSVRRVVPLLGKRVDIVGFSGLFAT